MENLYEGFMEEDLGSFEDIKDSKPYVPATKNVKFIVKSISKLLKKDGTQNPDWKQIKVGLQLVDGIINENGDVKWKNAIIWQNIPYSVNAEKYDRNKCLSAFKGFIEAFDIPLSSVKLNQELIDQIENRFVVADISVKEEKRKNPETGENEPTGNMINEVRYFKKCDVC